MVALRLTKSPARQAISPSLPAINHHPRSRLPRRFHFCWCEALSQSATCPQSPDSLLHTHMRATAGGPCSRIFPTKAIPRLGYPSDWSEPLGAFSYVVRFQFSATLRQPQAPTASRLCSRLGTCLTLRKICSLGCPRPPGLDSLSGYLPWPRSASEYCNSYSTKLFKGRARGGLKMRLWPSQQEQPLPQLGGKGSVFSSEPRVSCALRVGRE